MDDDYYSIDAIIAENQKLQCTMKLDVPKLGYLDGGAHPDIKALAKLQLPCWLAPTLLYAGWAEFTIPQPFNQRVRNALNAEPRSVRLSGLVGGTGTWYGFGRMIAQLLDEEQEKELSGVLLNTFKARLVDLMDQAQHFDGAAGAAGSGSGDPGEEFREGLDATERELFMIAQESAKRTKAWYESTDQSK